MLYNAGALWSTEPKTVSVVFQFEGAGCVGLLQNAVLLRSVLEQLPSTALVTLGAV